MGGVICAAHTALVPANTVTVPAGAGPERLLTLKLATSVPSEPKAIAEADSASAVNVVLLGWLTRGACCAALAGLAAMIPAASALAAALASTASVRLSLITVLLLSGRRSAEPRRRGSGGPPRAHPKAAWQA